MYRQFFGLEKTPFSIAPDPEFLYMSSRHQEGIAHLLYGINMGGGFVALTGEVGTGKTTLCNSLLEQIPEDVDIAYILNPKLNSVELLASICDELAIEYPLHSNSIKVFNDLLNKRLLEAHAKGRRTVLIIDEAQNLSLEVLEQIRLLTNLETTTTKLLQIILIGQPELKDLLNNKKLRQLNQRITARYHLGPLSLKETLTYIEHRIKVSGGRKGIFNNRAIKRIYHLTRGIPRLINILCDRSLLGAYSFEFHTVNSAIVNKAAQEVLPEQQPDHKFRNTVIFLTLLGLIPLTIYFGKFFSSSKQSPVTKQQALIKPNPNKLKSTVKQNIPAKQPVVIVPEKVVAAPKQALKPKMPPKFSEFINNTSLSMGKAINLALQQWEIDMPKNFLAECLFVQKVGLRCLPGKTNWYQLIKMKRPVILELTLENKQKRFVLLIGVIKEHVIILTDQEYQFPVQDLLTYWNGYYLALWKPPTENFQLLYPGQNTNDILWLRRNLNRLEGIDKTVNRPAFYDTNLEQRVKRFQGKLHLSQDGLVGPLTAIHLQNTMPNNDAPKLR